VRKKYSKIKEYKINLLYGTILMILGFLGIVINLYYEQWIDLSLATTTLILGLYLANKEKKKKVTKYGNIKVFEGLDKDTFICEIENNKFEYVKNSLIEQFEALGYNLSINLPNIIKLSTSDSYVQLKYSIGNNNLTLESLNSEMPNIIKDLSFST